MLRNTRMIVMGLLSFVVVAFAADLDGRWEGRITPPGGGDEVAIAFIFKVEGDKVGGIVETPIGPLAITNGKIAGNEITFAVDFNGNAVPHKGTVDGDTLNVKVEGEMAMEFTLKRVPKK